MPIIPIEIISDPICPWVCSRHPRAFFTPQQKKEKVKMANRMSYEWKVLYGVPHPAARDHPLPKDIPGRIKGCIRDILEAVFH
jgi:hypothetical protein